MRVWVSKEDVEEGCLNECDNCPLARAVARKLGRSVWFNETNSDNRPCGIGFHNSKPPVYIITSKLTTMPATMGGSIYHAATKPGYVYLKEIR